MLYFRYWQRGEGCQTSVQRLTAPTPRPLATSRARAFIDRSEGAGGLTRVILVVLGTVKLRFQGRFVSISLRPVFRTVAAYVVDTVWSWYS